MSATGFAINGRFYGQPLTGVQRYARQVAQAMDASLARQGHTAVVLTPRGVDVPAMTGLVHRPIGPGSGHLWEQTTLPVRWGGRLLNMCNTAPASRVDQVVCIHDVNVFKAPQSYSRAFRTVYRALLPLLASRVVRVATGSYDTVSKLAAHLPIRASDIAVLRSGHEHALAWDPRRSTLGDAPRARPYVLALGSRAKHKNIGLLISIAPALDALGLDLVVAGGSSGIFADVDEKTHPNMHRLASVSDDDIAYLMDHALCLAFPSFTEGFGLPIVEAMARGCPVVSSDRDSMPEVCGDAALLAAPDNAAAWAAHVSALAKSPDLRADLAGRGREQASLFSWKETAEGYLSLMQDPRASLFTRASGAVAAPAAEDGMSASVAPVPTGSTAALAGEPGPSSDTRGLA